MNKVIQIGNVITFLTALATLLCTQSSAEELEGQELLDKLRSLDKSFLHTQTTVIEMERPEYDIQLRYEGSTKKKTTLTSDDGRMAIECERWYMSEPIYRTGSEPIDYDKDGNYLVWRNIRSCSLLEPDLHAQQRERILIRVTPQGDLIEQEGAPVVEFYEPADSSWMFLDFMLPIWATGRGFAEHLSRITEVDQDQQSGLINFRASGSFSPKIEGTWEMSVDPKAAYLVRSASFTPNRGVSPSFICTTTGTKWFDTCCLAKKATIKMDADIPPLNDNVITAASKEFKPQADMALFSKARNLLRGPLPKDTDVIDFRVTPTLKYRVGKLPMTDRELLDVVADAELAIFDTNQAALKQVSITADANSEPMDANHLRYGTTSPAPNRDGGRYAIFALAAVVVGVVAIGAIYASKRAKN